MKRHLTQSEKHKYLVEGRNIHNLEDGNVTRHHATRIVECPQNTVELRRYLQTCQELERARHRCVSSMNGEEHLLLMKYKDLLLKSGNSALNETFLMTPGFRFTRSGDVKRPSPLILKKPPSLRDHKLSSCNLSSKKSSKFTLSEGTKEGSKREGEISTLMVQVDPRKQIEGVEELQQKRTSKEVRDIRERVGNLGRSLTFLRGHVTDPLPLKRLSSPRPTRPTLSPVCMSGIFHGGSYGQKGVRVSPGNLKSKRERLAERLGRHVTKSNCVACEFRLRSKEEGWQVHRKSTRLVRPWKLAPSGTYVRKLDNPDSSPSLSTRGVGTVSELSQKSGTVFNVLTTTSLPACFATGKRLTARGSCGPSLRGQVLKMAALQTVGSEPCCSNKNRPRPTPSDSDPPAASKKDSTANLSDRSIPLALGGTASSYTSKLKEYSTEDGYHLVMGRSSISNKENRELIARLSSNPVGDHVATNSSENRQPTQSRQKGYKRQIMLRPSSKDSGEKTVSAAALQARAHTEALFTQMKVSQFLDKLPQPSSSITTWISSSGEVVRAEDRRRTMEEAGRAVTAMSLMAAKAECFDEDDGKKESNDITSEEGRVLKLEVKRAATVMAIGAGRNARRKENDDDNTEVDETTKEVDLELQRFKELENCRYLRLRTRKVAETLPSEESLYLHETSTD